MDKEEALKFHAQEFTEVERVALKEWLRLVLELIHPQLAIQVLVAGLDLEHYTSELAPDPADRTPFQVAEQQRLLTIFNEYLAKAEKPAIQLPTPGNLHPNEKNPVPPSI